jgi:tagatose-6-phosphate ketose/aldose isomerase
MAVTENHTISEIRQQPSTWMDTAQRAERALSDLEWSVEGSQAVVVTGSGSSEYAAQCFAPLLQAALGAPAMAIAAGSIVMDGSRALPPLDTGTLISVARSGESPESCAAVDRVLRVQPRWRHLFITCNANGRLATTYRGDERVRALVLDERTNDKSVVMTSSFTSMVVAGLRLAIRNKYEDAIQRLVRAAEVVLGSESILRHVASEKFDRAVYLGSGALYGAAREAALKMLEMTSGRVITFGETFLGVRHGPMSAITPETLVVCFLSSDMGRRAYELDLIQELRRKQLGHDVVVVGSSLGSDIEATALELPPDLPQDADAVVHVVAGQLLAYHRCLKEGLDPDAPSEGGVITRVVGGFRIH